MEGEEEERRVGVLGKSLGESLASPTSIGRGGATSREVWMLVGCAFNLADVKPSNTQ